MRVLTDMLCGVAYPTALLNPSQRDLTAPEAEFALPTGNLFPSVATTVGRHKHSVAYGSTGTMSVPSSPLQPEGFTSSFGSDGWPAGASDTAYSSSLRVSHLTVGVNNGGGSGSGGGNRPRPSTAISTAGLAALSGAHIPSGADSSSSAVADASLLLPATLDARYWSPSGGVVPSGDGGGRATPVSSTRSVSALTRLANVRDRNDQLLTRARVGTSVGRSRSDSSK